jgi:hypothetical protein
MAFREQTRPNSYTEEKGRLSRLLGPECPLTHTERHFLETRYGEIGLSQAITDLFNSSRDNPGLVLHISASGRPTAFWRSEPARTYEEAGQAHSVSGSRAQAVCSQALEKVTYWWQHGSSQAVRMFMDLLDETTREKYREYTESRMILLDASMAFRYDRPAQDLSKGAADHMQANRRLSGRERDFVRELLRDG